MTERITVFALLLTYKLAILIAGLAFCYMGYRLFLADKTASAGDLTAQSGKYALSLRGGAPGVFFSLFGTILICFSIFKGVEYEYTPAPNGSVPRLIPDAPPRLDEDAR